MSEITYDEFEKMEEAEVTKSGYTEPKYDERDFVLEILKERPYSRAELKKISEDAGLRFSVSGTGYHSNVEDEIKGLIKDGLVESRYGLKGAIYFALKRDES